MYRRLAIAVLVSICALAAGAADGWTRYQNDRYGYGLDIPPGFSAVREADNSDGGTSASKQGRAKLAVWGTNLLVESFKSEANDRIADVSNDDWEISYQRVTTTSASWSGTKDGRILYAHGAPGYDGQAAYFQLEYDESARDEFDAIVKRMVQGFTAKGECP